MPHGLNHPEWPWVESNRPEQMRDNQLTVACPALLHGTWRDGGVGVDSYRLPLSRCWKSFDDALP